MQERYESTSAPTSGVESARYIYLGPFQIDQQRQEITKEGERLKLQGKVYQVLMALLEKPGEVVTREEIRQRLWPAETHVNFDANVNTTVNKLRLALGDSSEKPVFIETIPRKGYCLLVQPESSAMPRPVTPQVVHHSQNAELPPAAPTQANTRLWVIAGIVGLILAGIVIGASLTRMWISHFGPVSSWP